MSSVRKEKDSEKMEEESKKKRGRKCMLLELGSFVSCTGMYISVN